MGLQTEFPILVCDLASGTDAIMGTDVLGSVLPHTLDIKNGLLFTDGGASLQLHRRDAALSGRVFTVGHYSVPPYSEAVLHCTIHTAGGRLMPLVDCWTIDGSMMRLSRTPIPCPELTILWICWPVNSGSLLWTRRRSRHILGCFSSRSCRSDCAMHRPHWDHLA